MARGPPEKTPPFYYAAPPGRPAPRTATGWIEVGIEVFRIEHSAMNINMHALTQRPDVATALPCLESKTSAEC